MAEIVTIARYRKMTKAGIRRAAENGPTPTMRGESQRKQVLKDVTATAD